MTDGSRSMHCSSTRRWLHLALWGVMAAWPGVNAAVADAPDCSAAASTACYFSFQPAGVKGNFHYYASRAPALNMAVPAPAAALVALHGHPRDANKTFNAALLAVKRADAADKVLVVAPVFQVGAQQAARCQTAGVPAAQPGDLLWTCASCLKGGGAKASGSEGMGSFAAMDALVLELTQRWPSLKTITIAGFSAGAQMVQHDIGFATAAPAGVALRYVVADPGSWLYFDAMRPQTLLAGGAVAWSQCGGGADAMGDCTLAFTQANGAACLAVNRWKYGMQGLPPELLAGRDAAGIRAQYAKADISYMAGALDSGEAPGASYKILDKSCAAQAQGPYRLQRGLAYAEYDRTLLAPSMQRRVTIVPACAHAVACVFPAAAARAALLGPGY